MSKGKVEENIEKIDFETFIYSLGTSALISLGAIANPLNQKMEINLNEARHNIEVIELIQEKTTGNLSDKEQKVLSAILHETRSKYIEVVKKEAIKV